MSEEIEWEEPPPPLGGRKGLGRRQRFVEQLKKRPGVWAVYNRGASSKLDTANAGSFKRAFPGVEAVSRQGTTYVRWVGDSDE